VRRGTTYDAALLEHIVTPIRRPTLHDACQAHLKGELPVAELQALDNLIREAITES